MISKNNFPCTRKTHFSFYHFNWLRVFMASCKALVKNSVVDKIEIFFLNATLKDFQPIQVILKP